MILLIRLRVICRQVIYTVKQHLTSICILFFCIQTQTMAEMGLILFCGLLLNFS